MTQVLIETLDFDRRESSVLIPLADQPHRYRWRYDTTGHTRPLPAGFEEPPELPDWEAEAAFIERFQRALGELSE
jgi:hypothetical protein